jgi:hypothetical protein
MPPIGLEPRAIVHAADQPEQIQLRPPQKNHLAAQVLSRPRGNKLSFRRIRLTTAFGETSRPAVLQQHANGTQSELCVWRQQKQLWWRQRTNARHSFPAPDRGACGSPPALCLVTTARPSGCPPSVDLAVPRPWPRGDGWRSAGENAATLNPRRQQFLNGVGSALCRTGKASATEAVGRNHGRTCSRDYTGVSAHC